MKRWCTYLLMAIPFLSQGQNSIDLFTLSGFYGAPAAYTAPLNGRATESGGLINLKVPIVLSDKTMWYTDFTYSLFTITTDLNPEPQDYLTSMRMHGFILQTGIAQKINDTNGFQLLFVPRYNTDFKSTDKKNWQFGGIALYEHRYRENLLMRYGALFNYELFGPLLSPLVYLDWRLSDRWSIIGLVPINLKVNYKISNQLIGGFSHFGFTTTYRLGQEEFRTDYIERVSIDETLFLRLKMMGNLHLETRVGYTIGRVYEQYEADETMKFRLSIIHIGDNREMKNVLFTSGLIGSVRLVYNLPLDH
jgi:hypothetical protein